MNWKYVISLSILVAIIICPAGCVPRQEDSIDHRVHLMGFVEDATRELRHSDVGLLTLKQVQVLVPTPEHILTASQLYEFLCDETGYDQDLAGEMMDTIFYRYRSCYNKYTLSTGRWKTDESFLECSIWLFAWSNPAEGTVCGGTFILTCQRLDFVRSSYYLFKDEKLIYTGGLYRPRNYRRKR